MSTAEMIRTNGAGIAPAPPPAPRLPVALAPSSYGEMFTLAENMHRSKMFGVSSPEQALVVLMTGLELGFSPAQAFRGIHVINNKPTLSADMMAAVCKARPDVCHFFRVVETTDERATYETHRVGDPEPQRITFTLADAKRAGLTSNPTWTKFPAQMLRARAASGLARMVYSDLMLGLYTPEEAEAITPSPITPDPPRSQPRNVTPTPRPQPQPEPISPGTAALVDERKEKVARLVDLMRPLSDADRSAWLDRFEHHWGSRNVKNLDLASLDEAAAAVASNDWPYEDKFQENNKFQEDKHPAAEASAVIEAEEADPFDDTPALLAVPAVGGKGHGDS